MPTLVVHLETLPPVWVAAVRAFGAEPEVDAWQRLRAWAQPLGLLDDIERHPVFGFNSPSPSPGATEYGYELWVGVDGPGAPTGGVTFKRFEGGRFAVTMCRVLGEPGVPAAWHALWQWVQSSPYTYRNAQELERVLNPGADEANLILELYLPIEEEGGSS
jgi:DNA gyrase inhibitor GyrI